MTGRVSLANVLLAGRVRETFMPARFEHAAGGAAEARL